MPAAALWSGHSLLLSRLRQLSKSKHRPEILNPWFRRPVAPKNAPDRLNPERGRLRRHRQQHHIESHRMLVSAPVRIDFRTTSRQSSVTTIAITAHTGQNPGLVNTRLVNTATLPFATGLDRVTERHRSSGTAG